MKYLLEFVHELTDVLNKRRKEMHLTDVLNTKPFK